MDMQSTLDARSAAAFPQVDPPRIVIDGDGRIRFRHELLENTHYAVSGVSGGVDAEGGPTPHALTEYDGAVRDIARRMRREAVFDRIDQDLEWDRPWSRFDRPPSWATLTHPLFAYALRMNGVNDLTGEGLADGSSGSPGVRVRCIQDMTIGRAMLDPAHPAAGKVGCDTAGATLMLEAEIPETTRHMLRGRALGALVQLRGCGDSHIDGIVASIPVLHVQQADGDANITVQLAPVPWIAPADAPRGVDVGEIRRDAPCR